MARCVRLWFGTARTIQGTVGQKNDSAGAFRISLARCHCVSFCASLFLEFARHYCRLSVFAVVTRADNMAELVRWLFCVAEKIEATRNCASAGFDRPSGSLPFTVGEGSSCS